MTVNTQIGACKTNAVRWGMAGLALLLALPAMAANVLQDVKYSAAPGGKVDITLQFSQPVGNVQAFTTDTPPRIAIDLPDTPNGLSQRRLAIGSGATSAVSAAEAGGRTRVVVDLFRPAGYTTRSAGNLLVLTVDAGVQGVTASTAMASSNDPTKRVASTLTVSNIDFRRGDNGAGRVILRFSGDGAAADMRNEGSQVIVDVSNASIPENLRRRLEVGDFATPVTSLEPRANAGSTRLVINTNGQADTMAYQTGNEYVVEVAPKRATAVVSAAPSGVRAAGAVAPASGAQRYAGRPVTFNFQDVPVRTVLQLIAEESNLNIVASDTVAGNVTLRLINVPWDQAMEIVLRAKGLDKRRDGNVVWVAPQKELSDYEQAREDSRIALETREETITEYIPINYGSAEDIAKLLMSGGGGGAGQAGSGAGSATRGFLSSRGSVTADNRTNTLLVVDIPKKVAEIKQLLLTLDRPVDQVLIEARIVIANENFARELGATFGINERRTGNEGTVTDDRDISGGFDLSFPAAAGAASFNLSILRPNASLDLELQALETEGRGEVVSNPRVITSNQREAIIRQGTEFGYVVPVAPGADTLPAPAFKEAILEMKVTPTITQDGRVYLVMAIKKDEIAGETAGVPSLSKREVSTAVLVDNGQTVVIGGVYEFRNLDDVSKVPFLGNLPLLGNLFRKTGKTRDKAELLIFVTPRVLQTSKR